MFMGLRNSICILLMVMLLLVSSEAAAGTSAVLAGGFVHRAYIQEEFTRELKNEPLPSYRHREKKLQT